MQAGVQRTSPTGCATSDDFAWNLGLGADRGWWAQTAMRGSPEDARPHYAGENAVVAEDATSSAADQMTAAGRQAQREREHEAGRARVEKFATQLRQRGFATVQLHPSGAADTAAADADATAVAAGGLDPAIVCTHSVCGTKLTKYVPTDMHVYTCALTADGKDIECELGERDAEEATTVRARAVTAQPKQAEAELSNASQLKGAVALVQRGGCTFLEKAERAVAAGAVAIVSIDSDSDLAGSTELNVPTDVDLSPIPVLMVRAHDGAALESAAEVVLDIGIDPDSVLACSVCEVEENTSPAAADARGPRQCDWWRCETCAESEGEWKSIVVMCNVCYQDQLKYQPTVSAFRKVVPDADRCVQRMFGLEPATKFALRTGLQDDGYTHIEGDKELFHWSGKSQGLISDRFGQPSAIGMLRTRLLNLGADIISSLVQCEAGLKLPRPVFANNRRIGHRGWVWKDRYEDLLSREGGGVVANPDYLTEEETSECNEWLYKGLACPNTSLLSAFRYVPKPGPMHCEAHKDKGLLTIVLNPSGGLEARVDGEWVPMSEDKDKLGQPLGSNCAVVFSGQTLEAATAGAFRATEHRVRNVGGQRTSIVAKLRCSPDAELNVPWAVRKVLHAAAGAPAPASVSMAELLTRVDAGRHGSSRSVNPQQKHGDSAASSGGSGSASKAALDFRPTKLPTHEHVFGRPRTLAGRHTGLGLAGLPIEVLTQVLSEAGVVSLGRLACVCVWLRQLATHEKCWVTAANAANMDWVTMVAAQITAGAAVRWHVALGPRLSAWEQNTRISLWLTTDGDYAFTNGRALAGRAPYSSIPKDMTEDPGSVRIQVDQRTALSTAVAEFVEKQFPKEGAWGDEGVVVYQGRPSRLQSGYYNSELQRINLNLTAWHHQLEDGAILGFERADMLAD